MQLGMFGQGASASIRSAVKKFFEFMENKGKDSDAQCMLKYEGIISPILVKFEKKKIWKNSTTSVAFAVDCENNKPTVAITGDLYDNPECSRKMKSVYGALIYKLPETEINIQRIESLFAAPSFDNLVFAHKETIGSKTTLYFCMWNTLPGLNDDYYKLSFEVSTAGISESHIYVFASDVIKDTLNELVDVYTKIRLPISGNRRRLEFELLILYDMFYQNISIKEKSGGQGYLLEIPMRRKTDIIQIQLPNTYPRQKPDVVIKSGNNLMRVEIDNKWNDCFTVVHIVKAIEKMA